MNGGDATLRIDRIFREKRVTNEQMLFRDDLFADFWRILPTQNPLRSS